MIFQNFRKVGNGVLKFFACGAIWKTGYYVFSPAALFLITENWLKILFLGAKSDFFRACGAFGKIGFQKNRLRRNFKNGVLNFSKFLKSLSGVLRFFVFKFRKLDRGSKFFRLRRNLAAGVLSRGGLVLIAWYVSRCGRFVRNTNMTKKYKGSC